MKFFNPNGAQERFIQKIGGGDVFVAVFSAANGVGKTALMASIAGHIVYGQESTNNPYFRYPLFKKFPFPHRGRIASTKKNIEEIGAIQTELKKWWPKGEFESRRMGKFYDSEFKAKDWVIDIMSYEQDVSQYESATLGLMIFDEPPPLGIFFASVSRMRKGGVILIFMTPLDTGGELLEYLSEKPHIDFDGKEIGKVEIIYADIEENCVQHGNRGQLEHGHIEQMIALMDPEEKEARARGKPVHLIGRIYPSFEVSEPFVCEDIDVINEYPGGMIVQLVDPHDAIPFAITWAYIDRTGVMWIYDEYPSEDLEKVKQTNLTYPDYSRIIREHEGRRMADVRIIDPYFGNKTYGDAMNRDGKSPKDEFESMGLSYIDGDTSGIETGHKRVREFLKYDRLRPVDSLNHPKLKILKKCRNHWRSMINYKRKMKKDGEVKDKIIIDETYKHFCDNIRHLCMKYDEIRNPVKSNQIKSTSHMAGGGAGGW